MTFSYGHIQMCKDFLPKFSPMDNFIVEILTRVKFSWKSSPMSDFTMEIFTNMMVSVEVVYGYVHEHEFFQCNLYRYETFLWKSWEQCEVFLLTISSM